MPFLFSLKSRYRNSCFQSLETVAQVPLACASRRKKYIGREKQKGDQGARGRETRDGDSSACPRGPPKSFFFLFSYSERLERE